MRIWEEVYGPARPNVAKALNVLGSIFYAQRKFERAREMEERVIAIKEKRRAPETNHRAKAARQGATR